MLHSVAPDFDAETADDHIIFFTRKNLDFHNTETWEQFSQLVFGVGAAIVNGPRASWQDLQAMRPRQQNPDGGSSAEAE